MNYLKAVLKLRPGAQIALIGGLEYENIDWHGEDPIPKATLDAEMDGMALDDARAAKYAQITKDRDAACIADVTVGGHVWQADMHSQWLLSNAIRRGKAGKQLPPVWRDSGNENVPVASVSQLEAIEDAIVAQTQAAYAASWARKAALEAAQSLEDIDLV